MWPQRSQVSALAIDQSLQADGALVQQGVYVPAARRPFSSRTMRRKLNQRLHAVDTPDVAPQPHY
jgi:hypothetical protein